MPAREPIGSTLGTGIGGRAATVAGLLLAVALAVLGIAGAALEARWLGHAPIEGLVLAMLLGILVGSLSRGATWFLPGAALAAGPVLEAAVAILGLSVDVRAVLASGVGLLVVIVVGVAGSMVAAYGIGRLLGLSSRLSALIAVGTSICGNSAIAALAPVIRASASDVASSISLTALLGVVQILLLPATAIVLGLSDNQYGVVAGISVYAVPQVLAVTLPVSAASAAVATVVKLTRVLLLGPVVLVVASLFRRSEAVSSSEPAATGSARLPWFRGVPRFLVAFLAFATLRAVGLVPQPIAANATVVSGLLTVVAMAGLGLRVDLAAVRGVGARVALTVLVSMTLLVGYAIVAARIVA